MQRGVLKNLGIDFKPPYCILLKKRGDGMMLKGYLEEDESGSKVKYELKKGRNRR